MTYKISYRVFAITVLSNASKPMSAEEIWNEGVRQHFHERLASAGGTPVASLSALLYTAALKEHSSGIASIGSRPKRFYLSQNSNIAQSKIDKYKTPVKKESQSSNADQPHGIDKEHSSFSKKLDYSTLTRGITIPAKKHDVFLNNISVSLKQGDSHQVAIYFEGRKFYVSMRNIGFSDPDLSNIIQILWSRKSDLATTLQATFQDAYFQLEQDHGNRDGINEVITVACGTALDEFILECSIPDAVTQGEEREITSCNYEKSDTGKKSETTKPMSGSENWYEGVMQHLHELLASIVKTPAASLGKINYIAALKEHSSGIASIGSRPKRFYLSQNSNIAQSKIDKYKTPVKRESQSSNTDQLHGIDKEHSSFSKKLDYSTLTQGITIPVQKHDVFLNNTSVPLNRGESHQVVIYFEGRKFYANMIHVGFSDPDVPSVIQILWSRKSDLATTLQTTFQDSYCLLEQDHGRRDGINEVITVSCGTALDEFILECSIPDAVTQGEEREITSCNYEKSDADAVKQRETTFTLDAIPGDLIYTKPNKVTLQNVDYELCSWKDLLRVIATQLDKEFHQKLLSLRNERFGDFTNRVCFRPSSYGLISPIKVSHDLWLESNFNAKSLVRFAACLVSECGIDLSSVKIGYGGMASVSRESSPNVTVSQNAFNIMAFEKALLGEFPSGCEWTNSTIDLLKKTVGQDASDADMQSLKRLMFKRSDGVYLLPEMVADAHVIKEITEKCEAYLNDHLCFSLSVLYEEFKWAIKNLAEPDIDFRQFFLEAILPKLSSGGKVFGRQARQMCIPADYEEEEVLELIGGQLHDTLENAGDALLVEELVAEYSYLNLETVNWILREYCSDTIEIRIDELQYWKLFQFFYLPDDFGTVIKEIVEEIEQSEKTPSLSSIANVVEEQYGTNFRQDYALEDDEVMRQIISGCFNANEYKWKNNLLVKQSSQSKTNITDEFLKTQKGIFHESDFFAYADEQRGLKNQGMLILTFLRIKCIRLDKTHWISLEEFNGQSDFSVELSKRISSALNTMLGQKPFLPLGTLPNAFFSELPPITIFGQTYYWNAYMLASIAELKIPELRIVNTEPSPYTVTAMIIPQNAEYSGDVLDYVFKAMWQSGMQFYNADTVFDYLKSNQIRMMKTKKLFARISAYQGIE